MVSYLLAVTRKHNRLLHTQLLKGSDSLSTVGLDLVVDDDMARILAVDGDVDDGAHVMTVVPFGADAVHHLCVAHANHLITYPRTDAVTGNLLDLRDLTAVGSLIRESIAQGRANGMSGEMLDMGSHM